MAGPNPAAWARKSPARAGKKPRESRSGDEGERTFQSSLISLWKPYCSAPIPATPTEMMIIGGIDSYLRPPARTECRCLIANRRAKRALR